MTLDKAPKTGETVKQIVDEYEGKMPDEHLAAIVADFICTDHSADMIGEVCALLARMANDDGKGISNKELSEMFYTLARQYGSYEDKPVTDH